MRAWERARIELRQSLTTPGDLFNHCFWPALMLVTLWFLRDRAELLPSILGMNAAMAMVTMSQHLTADREDGTLLRARATPDGVRAYLAGKVISVAATVLIDLAIFVIPGIFITKVSNVAFDRIAWVLALGLLATLPLGAILGTLFPTARGQGLLTLPVLAVIGISGIFYPVTVLPGWVQATAQAFPVYWMGLGMRAAFLQAPGATAGIVAVLGAWAVGGLVLAPLVLRRSLTP
ncbi:ABC transporter permease [Dactylosporangium sp. CS-033363]|uniref:ABC transporter permease n=1 Tax=Dactylosporangium sp. CS-033363 TaxID=3239935 RepID=UPI003D932DF1